MLFSLLFRYFASSLCYIQGLILVLTMTNNLINYKSSLKDINIDINEFEAITSSSNSGSYCAVTSRLEHCFLFAFGIMMINIAYYIPVHNRSIPSICIGSCLYLISYQEYLLSTSSSSTDDDDDDSSSYPIKVYQGEFLQFIKDVLVPMNLIFATLHTIVGVGILLGLTNNSKSDKTEASNNDGDKNSKAKPY